VLVLLDGKEVMKAGGGLNKITECFETKYLRLTSVLNNMKVYGIQRVKFKMI